MQSSQYQIFNLIRGLSLLSKAFFYYDKNPPKIVLIANCITIANPKKYGYIYHVQIQKVLSEGVQLNTDNEFFVLFKLVLGWWIHQIPLKVGDHWPARETPFKWSLTGGPIMAQHWMLA